MVVYITKEMTVEQVDALLKAREENKGLDTKKYCGAIKWEEDGLKFQQRLRDEWE